MSRKILANDMEQFLIENDLNEVYGTDVNKRTANGKTFYSVIFCKARATDGEVRIYSPNFIQVRWQTQVRRLPHQGSIIAKSVTEAKDFIKNNFA